MPVGTEESIAAAALPSLLLGTHRASSRKKIQPPVQSQTAPPGRTKRRRKKSYRAGRGKKITRKKTDFQTAASPPLSFRR
jgi:hypothetical protein